MSKPVSYTNRKGKTYYLHAATTKKGQTRYVMKRTPDGALGELPEGYVITENVNGQVSVGRIAPRKITEEEEALVKTRLEALGLKRYRCEVKGGFITVFEPIEDEDDIRDLMQHLIGPFPTLIEKAVSEKIDRSPFDPVMRFQLLDEETRIFDVERMTYRGEGGWMCLFDPRPLKELVLKYLPHLGKDSFFQLV